MNDWPEEPPLSLLEAIINAALFVVLLWGVIGLATSVGL
jgi:hypothetical protein